MASVLEWLKDAGFDFFNGTIVWQELSGTPVEMPGEVLEMEFDENSGSPQCPRFIAQDQDKIYLPQRYERATQLVVVWKDISVYLTGQEQTPYPGGG